MIQLIVLQLFLLQPCLLMLVDEEHINIHVDSVNGNDSECSWDDSHPSRYILCANINKALEVLETDYKSITIEVSPGIYTLEYEKPVYYMYNDTKNLTIIGSDESNATVVECKPSSSRCLLEYTIRDKVTFESMIVQNCDGECGVAINLPALPCVSCGQKKVIKGWGLLIAFQFIPVTVMVAVIALLNVNLNQGSLKGYIFFCQTISKAFLIFVATDLETGFFSTWKGYIVLPYSIWNLAFIFWPPICISPNTTPLQAILFNHVVAFYPFLLLAIIYGCIVMYDKGWKWAVTIIRPIHRVLARFWRRFNIQPSLPHTIASVYTLCFTVIANTSLKILQPTTYNYKTVFFYDDSVMYFHGWHGVAGALALIVLIVFIIIPTIYILVYPLKYFQTCFNKMKFKKDLLISVTDVFTGPYKNGTDNSWDYRSFAGIYFVLQIVSLFIYCFIPGNQIKTVATIATAVCCVVIVAICVFRPYKRNIHTFTETTIMITILIPLVLTLDDSSMNYETYTTSFYGLTVAGSALTFLILLVAVCYCIVWMVRRFLCLCCNRPRIVHIEDGGADDQGDGEEDILTADRLVNPKDYDNEHQKLLEETVNYEVNPPNNVIQRPQYHQAMTY